MNNLEYKNSAIKMGYKEFLKQQLKDGLTFTKSSEKSTEFRKAGNKIYTTKEFEEDEDEDNGHGAEVHGLVLHYYTKSIALAPKDSEELALGYGNRSALLKHVKMYNECMIDIERALKVSQSDSYKNKVRDRKRECLNLIHKNPLNNLDGIDDAFKKLQLPKITRSKAIPSMASSAKLEYDENYGRHMVVTRDLKAGEIVAIEKGYTLYPVVDQQYCVCSHCLQLALNAVPCDECACAIYCTEQCRDDALKEYHYVECKILAFFYNQKSISTNMIHSLMAARLFIKAVIKEGLENIIKDARAIDNERKECMKGSFQSKVFSSQKFKSCYSLQSDENIANSLEDSKFYCSMIFEALDEYTDIFKSIENHEKVTETKSYIKEILIKLRRIIKVNFYYFQDFDCECYNIEMCYKFCNKILGFILTPSCSFFNHSCIPNVSRVFTSNKELVLFTNQPVKEGDQLFVSYGPTVNIKNSKRQDILEENYNFTCQCEACIKDWPAKLSDYQIEQLERSKRAFNNYKEEELQKFCMNENIEQSEASYDVESGIYDEKLLKYHSRNLELIYEHNSGFEAHVMAELSKSYVEKAFQKLYGVEYFMPDSC